MFGEYVGNKLITYNIQGLDTAKWGEQFGGRCMLSRYSYNQLISATPTTL
jgi:hypothetical protein